MPELTYTPTTVTTSGHAITDPVSFAICDDDEQRLYQWLIDQGYKEPFYTTEELQAYFKVISFTMPFVFVIRRADSKRGTLTWADAHVCPGCVKPDGSPVYARLYMDFTEYDFMR